jgi:hypothetical protein
MWTETTRLTYGREKLRYASDTPDEGLVTRTCFGG